MNDIESWLATLAGYVVSYRRQIDNGPALAQHLRTLIGPQGTEGGAKTVFKLLGGTRSAQEACIVLIGRNSTYRSGMPTPAYETALAAVRTQFDSHQLKRLLTSRDLTPEQNQLASLLLQMLRPDANTIEAKDARLDKLLAVVPDRILHLAMTPISSTRQSVHTNEIKHLVKIWTKRADHVLTPEEAADVRERDPERHKRYTKLHAQAREMWQQFVRGMVLQNGGKPVKVLDACKTLDAAGITYHPQLDSNGLARMRVGEATSINNSKPGTIVMYTMDGTEMNMIPASNLTIQFNPKWNPKTDNCYVLNQRSPFQEDGKVTRVRSAKFAGGNKEKGYSDILSAIPRVPASRKIWMHDLHGPDKTRRILGAMTEVMYHFAPRIGSLGNATVGLATLRVDHYRTTKDGAILDYIGKDSKPQKHVLSISGKSPIDPACISALRQLTMGKTRKDYLWTDAMRQHITPARLNEYIRTRCGFPLTGEKFRNVRGTELMQNMLGNARLAKDAPLAVVGKHVQKLAMSVGEMLGHVRTDKEGKLQTVANTAIKNYIVPSVVHDFFNNRGLQTPSWVPKQGRNGNGD